MLRKDKLFLECTLRLSLLCTVSMVTRPPSYPFKIILSLRNAVTFAETQQLNSLAKLQNHVTEFCAHSLW